MKNKVYTVQRQNSILFLEQKPRFKGKKFIAQRVVREAEGSERKKGKGKDDKGTEEEY